MTVLFFIVLPLATILIAIVLQKILKSPILVALLVFAVYLILAFTAFTTDFLINAIIYTLIAFITAIIVRTICCVQKRLNCNNNNGICCNSDETSLQNDIANLRTSINGLETNIEALENNIDNLTDILSTLISGNNCNCGCNRRIR